MTCLMVGFNEIIKKKSSGSEAMGGGGWPGGNFFFFNKLSPLSYRILSDEKNFAAHNFLQVDNLKHPLPKDKFYTNLIIYCIDRSKISFKL